MISDAQNPDWTAVDDTSSATWNIVNNGNTVNWVKIPT
jgi:hypothetical protein